MSVTFDPAAKSTHITLSGGDLVATSDGYSSGRTVKGTQSRSTGKWYSEITISTKGAGFISIGLANAAKDVELYLGGANGYAWFSYQTRYHNGSSLGDYGNAYTDGSIISVLFDADAGTLEYWKDGVTQGGVAFSGITGDWFPAVDFQSGTTPSVVANFGSTVFAYTPPVGYVGWDIPGPTPGICAVTLKPLTLYGARLAAGAVTLPALTLVGGYSAVGAVTLTTVGGELIPGGVTTLDPATATWNIALSGGNLVATEHVGETPGYFGAVKANRGKTTGRWYYEFTVTSGILAHDGIPIEASVGIVGPLHYTEYGNYPGDGGIEAAVGYFNNGHQSHMFGWDFAYGEPWGAGDTIGVRLDCDTGVVNFTKNGVDHGVAVFNLNLSSFIPEIALRTDDYSTASGVVNFGATAFAYPHAGYTAWDSASSLPVRVLGFLAAGAGGTRGGEVTLRALTATGIGHSAHIGAAVLEPITALGHGSTPPFTVGDWMLPLFSSAGTYLSQSRYTGNMRLPLFQMAGTVLSGNAFTGSWTLPLFVKSGQFGTYKYEGAWRFPLFAMTGHTESDIEQTYRAWPINLKNMALSEYQQFPHNSFARFNNEYLAAGNGGLFALTGDTDNGAPIDARIRFGEHDWGIEELKRLPEIFATYRSSGTLALRVIIDGGDIYSYILQPTGNTGMATNRTKIGKAIQSNYYTLEIVNINGVKFDLQNITLHPIVLSRKIGRPPVTRVFSGKMQLPGVSTTGQF